MENIRLAAENDFEIVAELDNNIIGFYWARVVEIEEDDRIL